MRRFAAAAAILTALWAWHAHAAGASEEYLKAKSCYGELKVSAEKSRERRSWERCAALFQKAHEKGLSPEEAAKAVFSIGRLRREMWERFKERSDAEAAIKAFNQLVREHPKSSLADDALLEIARLRIDPMGQPDRAAYALQYVIDNYPDGDMAERAKAELAAIDGGGAKPKGESPSAAGAAAGEAKAAQAKGSDAKALAEVRPEPDGRPAGPMSPATLAAVEVSGGPDETSVRLGLTRKVQYSAEFTEGGLRTKSPPKLDILLPYTKASPSISKETAVSSPHLKAIKIKRDILGGGTRLVFELADDASYAISSKGEWITVRFKRGGPEGKPKPASSMKARWGGKGEKPLTIVIDPGHGGSDTGAIGPGGTMEKDVALAISRELASRLEEELGAKVYLTRADDRYLTLEQRNAIAVKKKADLFISIHANASADRRMSGIETYYLDNATDEAAARLARRENKAAGKRLSDVEHILSTMLQNYDAAESQLLASDVQSSLVNMVSKRYTGVKNRKVRLALFYVLVGAKCPAILVETSFISNPVEERRLKAKGYREELARAIADGVKRYVRQADRRMVSL